MSLRARIALLGGGLLVGATALLALFLQQELILPQEAAFRDALVRDLRIAETLLADTDVLPGEGADRIGRLIGARVTLIARDGEVLAESGLAPADLLLLEGHGDRPEVRQALAGELALVVRFSTSLGEELVYAALQIDLLGAPVVLRLARPAAEMRAARGVLHRTLLLVGLGVLLLLLLLGGGVQGEQRKQLAEMESRVREMAAGRWEGGGLFAGLDRSFDPLVRALDLLEDEVSDRLRELLRERDELQGLVDSIAEGVMALTEDGRVLRMNQAAADLLELSHPAVFAPIGALIRQPDLRDYLEEAVLLPLPPREVRIGSRHLLVSTRPLAPGGTVVTLLDVTELRNLEQIRRDFVANASHELRTPLTAMRGFAETLLDGDPPEELRARFLEAIHSNAVRLQVLVDDLLDLSRLDAGSWRATEEEVDVGELAHEVWGEIVLAGSGTDHRFSVEGNALALADGQALHQIFRNLFDNALRFTPPGGEIRVAIREEGPFVRVGVSDTGAGIPSTALPRIFERFYRADSGRDRRAGGTGLGLAIVRHLVQSMGGEVRAESQLGRGTTIHFSLPLVSRGEART